MRKFIYNTVYDSTIGDFVTKILVNDGETTTILGPIPESTLLPPLYTEKDIKKITICDKLLSDSNLESMTIDEINYMLKK